MKPRFEIGDKVIEKEPIKEDLIKEEVSVIEVVEIIEQPTQIPDPEVAQENPERVLCPECNMYHDCELMRALIDLVLWGHHD